MSGEGGQYESSSLKSGSAPERFGDAAVPSSPAEVVLPLPETFLQLHDQHFTLLTCNILFLENTSKRHRAVYKP